MRDTIKSHRTSPATRLAGALGIAGATLLAGCGDDDAARISELEAAKQHLEQQHSAVQQELSLVDADVQRLTDANEKLAADAESAQAAVEIRAEAANQQADLYREQRDRLSKRVRDFELERGRHLKELIGLRQTTRDAARDADDLRRDNAELASSVGGVRQQMMDAQAQSDEQAQIAASLASQLTGVQGERDEVIARLRTSEDATELQANAAMRTMRRAENLELERDWLSQSLDTAEARLNELEGARDALTVALAQTDALQTEVGQARDSLRASTEETANIAMRAKRAEENHQLAVTRLNERAASLDTALENQDNILMRATREAENLVLERDAVVARLGALEAAQDEKDNALMRAMRESENLAVERDALSTRVDELSANSETMANELMRAMRASENQALEIATLTPQLEEAGTLLEANANERMRMMRETERVGLERDRLASQLTALTSSNNVLDSENIALKSQVRTLADDAAAANAALAHASTTIKAARAEVARTSAHSNNEVMRISRLAESLGTENTDLKQRLNAALSNDDDQNNALMRSMRSAERITLERDHLASVQGRLARELDVLETQSVALNSQLRDAVREAAVASAALTETNDKLNTTSAERDDLKNALFCGASQHGQGGTEGYRLQGDFRPTRNRIG